ncbi:MAG: hypothetical protein IT178_01905, partial [Acidobacteria bacterium]|nr:hypothetical protein [Acidobacteriota bacterium]
MPQPLLFVLLISSLSGAQTTLCGDAAACREATLQAIAEGRVEDAHDSAWRAMQRGPADDAELMFLLARAQSLSGRPDDALVMVRRLVERGVATEAATHPDLERMRGRPGWPAVEQLIAARAASAAPAPASAPAASVPSAAPSASVPSVSSVAPSGSAPSAA